MSAASVSRWIPALVATAGLAAALWLPEAPAAQVVPDEPAYAPDRVIIQFKAGTGEALRRDALQRVGARARALLRLDEPVRALAAPDPGAIMAASRLELVKTNRPVLEAVRILSRHPAVAFAEPDWILTHQADSNDPYYLNGSLWGMYGDATNPSNGFGSQAGEAWAAGNTGSSSVCVGVIDEGIDLNHVELAGNIWTNTFDADNGVDDDGNGYVDDLHGWDFYHNDNSIYDGSAGDNNTDSHGTHVSGTIGAVGGNGLGVAGVNWQVTLISGKFLGPNGGYTSDAVRAVNYFTDLKTRHGLNLVATNNSWGGGGYSQALHDAIIRGAKAGILFVAAAGNSGTNNDKRKSYPGNYDTTQGTSTESAAGYDAVISVAAISSSGARPTWSSYGAKTVDLGAPGVNVLSTTPNNTLAYFSGTSMATPHVTGAAALYAASHPGATALQIRTAILDAARATPTSSLNNRTVTGGRLNVSGF